MAAAVAVAGCERMGLDRWVVGVEGAVVGDKRVEWVAAVVGVAGLAGVALFDRTGSEK